ncbi:ALA-interacting subunit 1 [Hordeum vulgare]|nr:ALA-interacting subunit 1 [Hordeum vulgare]
MDASLLPPVTVEVAHAPSPRADLVAGHVGPAVAGHGGPAVAQASVAPARKRHGNVVVPGGNPTVPIAKARAPGAKAVLRSRPAAEKVTKVAGVKRKRIQAPPSSSHSIPERDAPAMPFNGVAPPASEVFDEMAGRSLLEVAQKCEKWKLIDKESLLLAEENKIMSMNRDDMDDLIKTWHDMAKREILKRRMEDSAPYDGNADELQDGLDGVE